MVDETKKRFLFLDVGGVLLTNGWDRHARKHAAEAFGLDHEEMNERHHLTFDTYEEGKLSLDEYLNRVVFYEPRDFSREDFRSFMFAQTRPLPEMIDFFRRLKKRHELRVVAVSNEGRELTGYRIREFGLDGLFDVFVASSFVHFRKPDPDIFRLAMDVSLAIPEETVYIDDRKMFVEIVRTLGVYGIHHTGPASTRTELERIGLPEPL